MSKQMREEFEAAYMKDVSERFRGAEVDDEEWVARNNNGEYRSYRAAGAWWAWNASRESQPSTYTAVDMGTAAADGFRDGAASVESMRKDAERYRWLSRNACDVTFWASGSPLAGCVEIDPRQYPVEVHGSAKASMDEQIDAVMSKEKLE